MRKKLVAAFVCFVSLIIIVSISYGQGSIKTITLSSGEAVCDLNGEWDVTYQHYGSLEWIGSIKSLLIITQQDNTFVGKTAKDSGFTPKGTEKIRGAIDRDGMKKVQRTRPDSDWADAKSVINKDCNKIEIDDGDALKIILERN